MSNALLLLMALINMGVALSHFKSNPGMFIVFASYATASVGFVISNLGLQ